MKTPTHFFNLEANKNQNGEQLIFFNLSYGYSEYNTTTQRNQYMPFRISTQQRILKDDWDAETYRALPAYVKRKGKTLNDQLSNVEKVSYTALNTFYSENERIPTPKELRELVLVKLDRKKKIIKDITLSYFISEKIKYFENLPLTASKKVGVGTIKTYRGILSQINKYQQATNEVLTFQNFDEKKYWGFFDVVNEVYKNEGVHPYGYMVNSISKMAKTFLTLLRLANDDGIVMSLNVNKKGLRIGELEKSNDAYLSEKHLQTILNTNVSHSSEFKNAKNYLLLSSLLGLRYDDMYHLRELKPNEYKGKNRNFIGIITQIRKVSEINKEIKACIPLLKIVRKLVDDNNGRFPSFPQNQPMNRQLKKLCKFLKFDELCECKYYYYKLDMPVIENTPFHELIDTHAGRKTFYTNLSQHQLSTTMIEKITHPKYSSKTMAAVYDNSSMIDDAEVFLNSLDKINSKIYKY